MNDYGKARIFIEGQQAPVLITYPAGEEFIFPCPASNAFLRFRNVRGGDWILPKAKIIKIQIWGGDDYSQERLLEAIATTEPSCNGWALK